MPTAHSDATPTNALAPDAPGAAPARLDLLQSLTGLFLALFMLVHTFLVSSILLGKDVMYAETRFLEGYYLFGRPYPILVTIVAAVIFVVFVAHALLAMRKFPASYQQYRTLRRLNRSLGHTDTRLWFIQAWTGFALFFLGSVHLYIMMTQPDRIGPYASADRVWSDYLWPLYLLLLITVEFHGGLGLYRLAVKWGWFQGADPVRARRNLRRFAFGLIAFLITLGLLTLATYMKIGYEHRDHVGERYVPTAQAPAPSRPESPR